jgi:hypothetical protein
MSVSRFRLRRWRWSVVLAIASVLMLATAAYAILLGGVTGTWSNAVTTVSNPTCAVTYDNTHGTGENQARWGDPATNNTNCSSTAYRSGYGFDGIDSQVDIPPSQNFLLGAFTHYNLPIYSSGGSISQVQLTLSLPICGTTKTFNYTLYHDETPNSASPCAYGQSSPSWPGGSSYPNVSGDTGPNRNGCADRVTMPATPPGTTFMCNNYEYTLSLSQFIPTSGSCPSTPSGTGSRYFYTAEETTNVACLYGQITAPSAITLASFDAAANGNAIQVTWDTASEIDNTGFNLYRDTSPAGLGIKLNSELIPSQAPNSPTGFSYSYTDAADLVPGTTYYYWLEDVNLEGNAVVHEPVSITYASPTAVSLAHFGAAAGGPGTLPLAGAGLAALTLAGAAVILDRRRA